MPAFADQPPSSIEALTTRLSAAETSLAAIAQALATGDIAAMQAIAAEQTTRGAAVAAVAGSIEAEQQARDVAIQAVDNRVGDEIFTRALEVQRLDGLIDSESILRSAGDAALDGRLALVEGSVMSGREAFATWEEASAAAEAGDISAKALVEIPSTDGGTHVDPITSAAGTKNSGVFKMVVGPPSGLTRIADNQSDAAAAARAEAIAARDAALAASGTIEDMKSSAQDWTALTPSFVSGQYVKPDGSIAAHAGFDIATVDLVGGEKLRLSAMVGLNSTAIAAFFDEHDVPITTTVGPNAASRRYTYLQFSAPANARKMRSSIITGTGATLSIEKRVVASRLNDAQKAGAALLRYQSVPFTTVAGKYIELSDGSIQTSATYNYIERALDGSERGIKISVRQQLLNVAYISWYDAFGTYISGTGGTSAASQLLDHLVVPPPNAWLMRVTGLASGSFDIKLLDVATGIADEVSSAAAAAAAAKSALLTWSAPAVTHSAAGKYIQASDGSVQSATGYTYDEYVLTGSEVAFRITANAYLTSVSYVSWYNAGGTQIAATPATNAQVQHDKILVVPPPGAAKLRVCSYNSAPLIETQDVVAGLGDKVTAATDAAAKAKTALEGYAPLALSVVAGQYVNYSNGTVGNSAGYSYYEAALPEGTTSIRVSGVTQGDVSAFVAFYAGTTYNQAASVAASAPKRQITDQVVPVPAGATKVRITVPEAGFVEVRALGYAAAMASRLEALEPQRAPTAYSFDYLTGTAFPTLTSNIDYLILVVGTSWSGGYNMEAADAPVSFLPVDPGNALMFNVGAYPNGRPVSGYVDLQEQIYSGGKETPCAGIASFVLSTLNARLGFKPRLIMAVGGKTGNAYGGGATAGTGNKRGSDANRECLRLVMRARQISASQGRELRVLAIINLSGENEKAVFPLIGERHFIDAQRQWRMDLEDDCRRITGQRQPIPMIVYQTSWTDSSAFGRFSPIQAAQLKIHDRDPLIFQSGPVYYVEQADTGHTWARWTRRIGRQLGRTLVEAVFGPYDVPLQVLDSWWVANNAFRLRLTEALALENDDSRIVLSTLPNPAGKGIEFDDGSGAPPLITGLSLQSSLIPNDTLEVTLAGAPTGFRKRALIAARSQAGGSLGRAFGGRSGIRSAVSTDTDPLDGYVAYKWLLADEVRL